MKSAWLSLVVMASGLLALPAYAEDDDEDPNYNPQTQVQMMRYARQVFAQDSALDRSQLRSEITGISGSQAAPSGGRTQGGGTRVHSSHRGGGGGGGYSASASAAPATSASANIASTAPISGGPTLAMAPPPLQAPPSAVAMPVLPVSPTGDVLR